MLVRAQRFRIQGMAFAFVIVQKRDHARILWHRGIDGCTVDFLGPNTHLRLDNGPNEAPIVVSIEDADPWELDNWLRMSDKYQ